MVPTHHARRVAAGSLTHPQMGCQVMRTGLQVNWKKRMMMTMTKSPVPPVMRLAWMALISSRVPTQASSLLKQTLPCHPMSPSVDYQGMAWCGHIRVFMMFVFY